MATKPKHTAIKFINLISANSAALNLVGISQNNLMFRTKNKESSITAYHKMSGDITTPKCVRRRHMSEEHRHTGRPKHEYQIRHDQKIFFLPLEPQQM